MTDLEPRARQLIDAARIEPGLDAETRAQGRSRLRTSLGSAGLAAAAVTAGSRSAFGAGAAGSSLAAKAAAGVSVVLVGGALYALVASHGDALLRPPSAPDRRAVASAEAAASAAIPPEAPPSPLAEPAASEARVVSAPPRQNPHSASAAASPSAPASARPDAAASLAADVKLLRDVRAALAAGRPDSALGLLQVRRKDPDPGGLAPEREAARLVTLCRLGRAEEARPGARGFLRAHPGSPLAARIREECP